MAIRFSPQSIVLLLFLCVCFFLGGGSRGDIASLAFLRPISVIVCAFGLWTLSREQLSHYRFLFVMAALLFAVPLLQLVPLPPLLWHVLPGRDLVIQADAAAGLEYIWRPISLTPGGSWNAFYALFVPLAILILAVQLSREDQWKMVLALLALGALSGLIGLLQVVGPNGGPLYFYRITNEYSAVGLFANRNHAAAFLACLFPMLAVFASTGVTTSGQARFRLWMCGAAAGILIPLLLVTGSRAGLLLGIVGMVASVFLYRKPVAAVPAKRTVAKKAPLILGLGFAIVGLGLLTILLSRAQAFERLMAGEQIDDVRFALWGPVADMVWNYLPFGSGMGSFAEVYQIREPYALLAPNYMPRAHNDLLEVLLTSGIFGLCLMVISLWAWLRRSWSVWRTNTTRQRFDLLPKMASLVIGMLLLASLADYPLRVPSLMALFVLMAVSLYDKSPVPSPEKNHRSSTSSRLGEVQFR